MKTSQHTKENEQHSQKTGHPAAKQPVANTAKLTKKQSDEKGTLQAGLGKDFLNDDGDPETAQEGLI